MKRDYISGNDAKLNKMNRLNLLELFLAKFWQKTAKKDHVLHRYHHILDVQLPKFIRFGWLNVSDQVDVMMPQIFIGCISALL